MSYLDWLENGNFLIINVKKIIAINLRFVYNIVVHFYGFFLCLLRWLIIILISSLNNINVIYPV